MVVDEGCCGTFYFLNNSPTLGEGIGESGHSNLKEKRFFMDI